MFTQVYENTSRSESSEVTLHMKIILSVKILMLRSTVMSHLTENIHASMNITTVFPKPIGIAEELSISLFHFVIYLQSTKLVFGKMHRFILSSAH